MKQKILIAEDNQFTALQYNRILEKNGHDVTITKNGEECINKYNEELKKLDNRLTNPYDVVILDQSMPKKSGKEVAQSILKKNPYQRIIFASAYDNGSDEKNSEPSIEDAEFLQKPFSLTKFVREVGN